MTQSGQEIPIIMSTTNIRDNGHTTTTAQDARQIGDLPIPTTQAPYHIDPAASRVEFTIHKRLFFVKHLLVTGRFAAVQGTISLDEQEPANSRADVTIGAASVDTGMGQRDKHLRKAAFFDSYSRVDTHICT